MSDWAVALLVIGITIIVAVIIAIMCRVVGIYHLTSCFTSGEEKQVLTKHEQYNGYMINSDTEFVLDTSGKFIQYDTLHSDPRYLTMEEGHLPTRHSPSGRHSPIQEESDRGSPTSVGSASVVSEVSEIGHGLQRAMSCDSVASDSSVLEMQPDMPKMGQLEVGLEYDGMSPRESNWKNDYGIIIQPYRGDESYRRHYIIIEKLSNCEASELAVSVIQARDLTANQYTGTLDTYVRGVIIPDSDAKFQTKVQKNSTDPLYKERFLFTIDQYEVDQRIVQLQVFSVDKYQRHKVIGEAEIRVGDIDLNYPIRTWLNLRDIDETHTEYGDILFSLSYLPTAERLTIVISKARNLKWNEEKDAGDPFVKVYLLQNGKKISKKKTTVKRGEHNPIFNEAMIFSVPSSVLQTVQLRITVAELLPDGRTPSLGHVIVGADTSGTELSHWNQMMTSLRKPTAMWHNLRK